MKKLLIAIAAIALLASCSKSDITYDEPSEIGIAPVAQNITKAMLNGTEFPNEQFNVWAYYKQLDLNTTVADWQASSKEQQIYIEEKPFQQTTTNAKLWGGVTPYFWPKVGSLMFVGYYPTSISEKVNHTFDANTNLMTITDYTPGMVSAATTHTEDVMYFNMTPTSYSGTTESSIDVTGNNVDVVFKHALSWISVILVKGADTPDNATITVSSVKFTNILPTGDAVVNGASAIAWTPEGTAANIEVCPDDDAKTTEVFENEVTLEKGNKTVLAKEPILIPQTMSGTVDAPKNLVVEYTISSNDGSKFTEVKTIQLSGMKDANETALSSWDAAKHYTYTITIGTTEILIDPAVENWTPVTVNVPVQ